MKLGIINKCFDFKFLLGQKLEAKHESALDNLDPNAPWHKQILIKHRRFVAVLIPLTFYRYTKFNDFFHINTIRNNRTNAKLNFFQYFFCHKIKNRPKH